MSEGSSDEDWFEKALQDEGSGSGDSPAGDPESDEPEDTTDESGSDAADSDDPGSGEKGPGTAKHREDEGTSAQASADEEETSEMAAAFDAKSETGSMPKKSGDGDPDGQTFGFDLDGPTDAAGAFGFGTEDVPGGFERSEYNTDLERVDVGIEGLDEMIQGGVPDRSLMVAIGGAGTGKTTFGLQFLEEALANGERGVFITLEESRERIVQSAREKGWDFAAYDEAGDLAIVDLDPVDMANSLTSIRNELPRLVEEFGASRLVLDSVSLLEMMYDDQATRRTEIYDFARALKEVGVTTMLTSEADEENPFASRFGVIEYLTDAVFVLRYVRPDDFRETRLAIEIQKIRDANHSRETKPYEITNTGIEVYRQANIF